MIWTLNKDTTTGIFLDVNYLYATVLSGKLPVSNFHELNEKEIKDLDLDKVDLNGNHCYALKVDFEIPDEFKKETDDLPMGINQEEIGIDDVSPFTKSLIENSKCNFTKQKTLVASHKSQENYMISLNFWRIV